MKSLLLCAGEGTRLRPYTLATPKPVIPFLGAPLASYTGALLKDLGVTDLVVNHHHLSTQVRSFFLNSSRDFKSVSFSDEDSELLGSGGALNKAQMHFRNETHFAVANGDEVILPHHPESLAKILAQHQDENRLATLVVTRHAGVGSHFGGAYADANLQVKTFSKTPIEGLTGWHFIGLAFFSNQVLKYLSKDLRPENILYETLASAIAAGEKVLVAPLDCAWFETGNPADFLNATRSCLEALTTTPRPAWARWLEKHLKSQPEFKLPVIEQQDPLLVSMLEKTLGQLR
jgi:mannose-1-phosphate guanylyltransferase